MPGCHLSLQRLWRGGPETGHVLMHVLLTAAELMSTQRWVINAEVTVLQKALNAAQQQTAWFVLFLRIASKDLESKSVTNRQHFSHCLYVC